MNNGLRLEIILNFYAKCVLMDVFFTLNVFLINLSTWRELAKIYIIYLQQNILIRRRDEKEETREGWQVATSFAQLLGSIINKFYNSCSDISYPAFQQCSPFQNVNVPLCRSFTSNHGVRKKFAMC